MLISKINQFEKNDIIISFKSTAHYGNNLVSFPVLKDSNVRVINTIQTATMQKKNISKVKTAKIDTMAIAKVIALTDNPRFISLHDITVI